MLLRVLLSPMVKNMGLREAFAIGSHERLPGIITLFVFIVVGLGQGSTAVLTQNVTAFAVGEKSKLKSLPHGCQEQKVD